MNSPSFTDFFQNTAKAFLLESIDMALREDGSDLTSRAVFQETDTMHASIVAKEDTLMAGLPLLPLILDRTARREAGAWEYTPFVAEAAFLPAGTMVASVTGSAHILLRAERIILNFISHLSGIANLVRLYVDALEGTGVRLLDTRKTLPGLRYPEKYAVLVGGGHNHRKNLEEMLMLKDNHIDASGSIRKAVAHLRDAYLDSPPIEVECRDLAEVREAVACGVNRIMLDNMAPAVIEEALLLVPQQIEVEISGGVSLENIRQFVTFSCPRKPDFISVGRLTHSAPAADFSMYITPGASA